MGCRRRCGRARAARRAGAGHRAVRRAPALRAPADDRDAGRAEPTIPWDELLDGPARPVAELERELDALIASIAEPHLGALLALDSLGAGASARRPPRSTTTTPTRTGCSSTRVDVAQAVERRCARLFPGIDRDLAVCGALLHDIGKLEAYADDAGLRDLTDAGKLEGEIPLGYYRVRREIEATPGFPRELAQALLHIILAHHGSPRARQPRRARHARGRARPRDGQPQRPDGRLRPPREGDGAGRALVALRPRAGRERVLRGGRAMTSWEEEAEAEEAAFWAEMEADELRWEAELDAERAAEPELDDATFLAATAPPPATPEPIQRAMKVGVAFGLIHLLTGWRPPGT